MQSAPVSSIAFPAHWRAQHCVAGGSVPRSLFARSNAFRRNPPRAARGPTTGPAANWTGPFSCVAAGRQRKQESASAHCCAELSERFRSYSGVDAQMVCEKQTGAKSAAFE